MIGDYKEDGGRDKGRDSWIYMNFDSTYAPDFRGINLTAIVSFK